MLHLPDECFPHTLQHCTAPLSLVACVRGLSRGADGAVLHSTGCRLADDELAKFC